MSKLLQQSIARASQARVQATLSAFTADLAAFGEAALSVASRKTNLDAASGSLWGYVRPIMVRVQAEGIDYIDWQTVVGAVLDPMLADVKASTVSAYKSTLLNGPFQVATDEATAWRADQGLPALDLATASYADVRATMKGADNVFRAKTDPNAVRYALLVSQITTALKACVKDQRAKDGAPGLSAIDYQTAIESAEAILGLIPERAEKTADADETPVTLPVDGPVLSQVA